MSYRIDKTGLWNKLQRYPRSRKLIADHFNMYPDEVERWIEGSVPYSEDIYLEICRLLEGVCTK